MPTKSKKSPLEKPDVEKDLQKELSKLLELKVEVPNIEEDISSIDKVLAQAQQFATKQKKLKTHKCTECGGSGIQLYHADAMFRDPSEHFACFVDEEGQFCDEHGEPFTDPDKLETLRQVRERGTVR